MDAIGRLVFEHAAERFQRGTQRVVQAHTTSLARLGLAMQGAATAAERLNEARAEVERRLR